MSKRISSNKKPNDLSGSSSKLKRIKKLLKSEKILTKILSVSLAILSLLQMGGHYVQGSSDNVKEDKSLSETSKKGKNGIFKCMAIALSFPLSGLVVATVAYLLSCKKSSSSSFSSSFEEFHEEEKENSNFVPAKKFHEEENPYYDFSDFD
jgi:hypothetical protein